MTVPVQPPRPPKPNGGENLSTRIKKWFRWLFTWRKKTRKKK